MSTSLLGKLFHEVFETVFSDVSSTALFESEYFKLIRDLLSINNGEIRLRLSYICYRCSYFQVILAM